MKRTVDAVGTEQGSERKFAKKRIALVLGYKGSAYSGLQVNPNVETIEKTLVEALFKAGGISDENKGDLHKIGWSRAARTDKGVHALGNIVSLKTDPDLDIDALNRLLPDDIHVFAKHRVTKNFNAKYATSSRFYEYVFPAYLFSPLPSEHGEEAADQFAKRDYSQLSSYKSTEKDREMMATILSMYVGTKNYYSFTSRRTAEDPSCQRYIRSFTLGEPFIFQGVEYLCATVHGDSFMLNQIRKMMGTAIALFHGLVPMDDMTSGNLFNPKRHYKLPIIPGLGLYLHHCVLDLYNQKVTKLETRDPKCGRQQLQLDAFADVFHSFLQREILPEICSKEKEEHTFQQWIAQGLVSPDWSDLLTE